jgi:hypothetical protein
MFPLSIKKSQFDEETKGSKERSQRRSKQKNKSKWKMSPYKKKIAAKLHKLKTVIGDTPERNKLIVPTQHKNYNISEYSNFMHGTKKSRSGSKHSSSKRKQSKDVSEKPCKLHF